MSDHVQPASLSRAPILPRSLPTGWTLDPETGAHHARLPITHPLHGRSVVARHPALGESFLASETLDGLLALIAEAIELGAVPPPAPSPVPHAEAVPVKAVAEWESTCQTCSKYEPDDLCNWHHTCQSEDCKESIAGETLLLVTVWYSDWWQEPAQAFCNAACFADAARGYHEGGWQDYAGWGHAVAMGAVLDLIANEPKNEIAAFSVEEQS